MSAISVQNIFKEYGDFQAVNGLSFHVNKGECLGLLGSNGAGKSTTMRIIIGQMHPSSGFVTVQGVDPTTDPKKVHASMGYVPDSQTVYDEITVEQNIDVLRRIYEEPKEKTKEIIDRLGLTEKAKTKVKNLSRGLKQRVLIARAIVHGPQVIIIDEPTTGLDPSAAEVIYEILEDFKKMGKTILLTTHLMNDVERLCDRIVFLHRGEKIEEGTPFDLKRKYRDVKLQIQTIEEGLLKHTELPFDQNFPAALGKIHADKYIYSINTHEPKLEDIFVKLTRQEI